MKEPTGVAVERILMTTYQLWQHSILGLFAVRLLAGHVTGVVGPLDLRTAVGPDCDLAAFDYDDRDQSLHRFVQSPEQFRFLGLWLQGRTRQSRPRKQ